MFEYQPFPKRPLVRGATIALAIGLIAWSAAGGAEAVSITRDLPVTEVVLHKNKGPGNEGLGLITHRGKIGGRGERLLEVNVSDVKRLLSEMVLKGPLTARAYGDFPEEALEGFSVSFKEDAFDPDVLLARLRGETVKLKIGGWGMGEETVNGTLLGFDESTVRMLDQKAGRVVREVFRSQIQSIELPAPLAREFATAAALLARRKPNRRNILIEWSNVNPRRCAEITYGYDMASWKAVYRLEIDSPDKGDLDAWAVVENQTPYDWKDVKLILLSDEHQYVVPHVSLLSQRSGLVRLFSCREIQVQMQVLLVESENADANSGTSVAVNPQLTLKVTNDDPGNKTGDPHLVSGPITIFKRERPGHRATFLARTTLPELPYVGKASGGGREPLKPSAWLPYGDGSQIEVTMDRGAEMPFEAQAIQRDKLTCSVKRTTTYSVENRGELPRRVTIWPRYAKGGSESIVTYSPKRDKDWEFAGSADEMAITVKGGATKKESFAEEQLNTSTTVDLRSADSKELKELCPAKCQIKAALSDIAQRREEIENVEKELASLQEQLNQLEQRQDDYLAVPSSYRHGYLARKCADEIQQLQKAVAQKRRHEAQLQQVLDALLNDLHVQ